MLVDPTTNKPTRVSIKIENDKKIRVAKSGTRHSGDKGEVTMASTTESTAPRLHAKYKADSVPALMKKFGYTNPCRCRA